MALVKNRATTKSARLTIPSSTNSMSQSINKGIKGSWSLVEFARQFSKMKVTSPLTNKETGEQFRSVAFMDNAGAITLVGFSSNLGELTAAEIAAQKDELQVVKLQSGSFKLCKSGEGSWETVDLGL